MREVIIMENDADQRLDRFLNKYLAKAPGSYLQKMIRKKKIKVNKKRTKPDYILALGDRVQFYIYEEVLEKFEKKEKKAQKKIPLSFVYENDAFSIIDKAKGVLSHAAKKKDYGNNIVDSFVEYLIETGEYIPRLEKSFRPGIVNRLDYNTEGLIIGVKNHEASVILNQAISDGSIEKYYRAVCKGIVEEEVTIEGDLIDEAGKARFAQEDEKGKSSKTKIRPLAYGDDCTYLDIQLFTGRLHQIRVHLASIGHPILGDQEYGGKKSKKEGIHSQMLIAYKLKFGQIQDKDEWSNQEFLSKRLDAFEKQFDWMI